MSCVAIRFCVLSYGRCRFDTVFAHNGLICMSELLLKHQPSQLRAGKSLSRSRSPATPNFLSACTYLAGSVIYTLYLKYINNILSSDVLFWLTSVRNCGDSRGFVRRFTVPEAAPFTAVLKFAAEQVR
jgi:hypothetical protein